MAQFMALGLAEVGVGEGAGVNDGDGAVAEDFEGVAGDDRGRVLVNAEAEFVRVLSDGGEGAAEAPALLEVLVNEDAGQESEPRAELDHAGAQRHARRAANDHHARHHGGAGAHAGDDQVALALEVEFGVEARDAELAGCHR